MDLVTEGDRVAEDLSTKDGDNSSLSLGSNALAFLGNFSSFNAHEIESSSFFSCSFI